MANNTDVCKSRFNYLIILQGVAVGALAGLVAVAYRLMIDKAGQVFPLVSELAKNNWLVVLGWFAVLVLAAFVVRLLVKWEPMISGSGIPQIEGEVHGLFNQNWWRVLFAKFVGGIIAIGAGLSLGREGPSIQLGGMVGKGFSGIARRTAAEEKLLITCGASAGLSAAFNAPFAGVLFALEEVHKNFSPDVLLSALASSVSANVVSRLICGGEPVFNFGLVQALPLNEYWLVLVLGVVMGLLGALYNRCIVGSQQLYSKVPEQVKMYIPFLLAGVLGFVFPGVLGSGHGWIDVLAEGNIVVGTIVLVFVVKFLFSMVSFGSGAPGGIFLPLLVMGALVGGIFGAAAVEYIGVGQAFLQTFVILAMAGFFSAIVRAPITGTILLCEMTGSFDQLLSLSMVSLVAYIVAQAVRSKPVYESLLERMRYAQKGL